MNGKPSAKRADEPILKFMARQNYLDRLAKDANAAAHDVYRAAIRSGRDLVLQTEADVRRFGQKVLRDAAEIPRSPSLVQAKGALDTSLASARKVAEQATTGAARRLERPVKAVAASAARKAGNAVGVVEGGLHAAEGLGDLVIFGSRLGLRDPSAIRQLDQAVADLAEGARRRLEEPGLILSDVAENAERLQRDLDPLASPSASSFGGEMRRQLDVGRNQGEFLFDVGSLALGGSAIRGMTGLGGMSKTARVEKYLAQGFSPAKAAHLASPYRGQGHHYMARRVGRALGLPQSLVDSAFNRLAPRDFDVGEMYERHFAVDPHFYGAGWPKHIPPKPGWSGKALGLQKHGLVGRVVYGSPPPLRAAVGGTLSGLGMVEDADLNGDRP